MNGSEIKDIWEKLHETRETVVAVVANQEHMEAKIDCMSGKIDHITVDLAKVNKNGSVQNAVQNVKINAWVWFIRISTVAIMGGFVSKLFNLW